MVISRIAQAFARPLPRETRDDDAERRKAREAALSALRTPTACLQIIHDGLAAQLHPEQLPALRWTNDAAELVRRAFDDDARPGR